MVAASTTAVLLLLVQFLCLADRALVEGRVAYMTVVVRFCQETAAAKAILRRRVT